mmetsp:Transcript_23285/g.62190  ORF Transcript_23285/g.62190 Transcript_23285/m.62190 type:complete len:547 (+) Transcript_23285:87-1727(+)
MRRRSKSAVLVVGEAGTRTWRRVVERGLGDRGSLRRRRHGHVRPARRRRGGRLDGLPPGVLASPHGSGQLRVTFGLLRLQEEVRGGGHGEQDDAETIDPIDAAAENQGAEHLREVEQRRAEPEDGERRGLHQLQLHSELDAHSKNDDREIHRGLPWMLQVQQSSVAGKVAQKGDFEPHSAAWPHHLTGEEQQRRQASVARQHVEREDPPEDGEAAGQGDPGEGLRHAFKIQPAMRDQDAPQSRQHGTRHDAALRRLRAREDPRERHDDRPQHVDVVMPLRCRVTEDPRVEAVLEAEHDAQDRGRGHLHGLLVGRRVVPGDFRGELADECATEVHHAREQPRVRDEWVRAHKERRGGPRSDQRGDDPDQHHRPHLRGHAERRLRLQAVPALRLVLVRVVPGHHRIVRRRPLVLRDGVEQDRPAHGVLNPRGLDDDRSPMPVIADLADIPIAMLVATPPESLPVDGLPARVAGPVPDVALPRLQLLELRDWVPVFADQLYPPRQRHRGRHRERLPSSRRRFFFFSSSLLFGGGLPNAHWADRDRADLA